MKPMHNKKMLELLEQKVHVEVPKNANLNAVLNKKYLAPFNEDVIAFVLHLSQALLKDEETKKLPELVSLAFWMRKKNIIDLKADFYKRSANLVLPRGLAFHIVPSNVDTIFIYSLFLSMFCGNSNVVRLSSQFNPQVEVLIRVLNESLAVFPNLAERMLLIRYDHSAEITDYFSSVCDLRMIWGGDETIRRIRQSPISPSAKELTFADKFSLGVLHAQTYNNYEQKEKLITAFYNDSYWFNQMACSSPRLVCWVGDDATIVKAQKDFWQRLHEHVVSHVPDISSAALMDKYLTQCCYAVESENITVEKMPDKYIARMQIPYGEPVKRDLHCGNGLFIETTLKDLGDLASILDAKDQTLTAFGFSDEILTSFIEDARPVGVDRIVPFGEALSFASVWDGYDLLFEMTRSVTVKT